MRALFIGCVLVCSCKSEQERKAPPTASTPVPVGKTATDEPQACPEPASPASFMCRRAELCAEPDDSGVIDLNSFLCLLTDREPDGSTQSMADILPQLPFSFRKNLSFKHGEQQSALRGHSMEKEDLTTTANIEQPRVVMWDEDSGFTISYNGGPIEGGGEQKSERELHMLVYDDAAAEFAFWSVDIPLVSKDGAWNMHPTQPMDRKSDCRRCHGEQSRPIWAMYPDWPGFFGSDTDELSQANPHQVKEEQAFARFRRCVVSGASASEACKESGDHQGDPHLRYAALFDANTEAGLAEHFRSIDTTAIRSYLKSKAAGDAKRKPQYRLTGKALAAMDGNDTALAEWLGLGLHPNYPYRPNHEKQKSEASRALFHRPNLRLGALYNRLNSRRIMSRIRKSPAYDPFKKLIAFTLMDCAWQADDILARDAVHADFEASIGKRLASLEMKLVAQDSDGRILYPALMAALGLSMRDVDIRFSYPNQHFDIFDRGYAKPTLAETPMDLGYIAYRERDNNQQNGATLYFNSYFDGSASFDELLVAKILEDIGEDYADLYELNSFHHKFGDVTSRFEMDKALFAKMDRLGKWFPLPYPKHLKDIHNRQAFLRRRAGAYPFRDQHTAVCSQLRLDIIAKR